MHIHSSNAFVKIVWQIRRGHEPIKKLKENSKILHKEKMDGH